MAGTTTTTKTLIVKMTMGGDIRRYTANEGLTWPQVAKRASEAFEMGAKKFKMTYVDDEGDQITVSSDEELREAVGLAFASTPAVLRVTVHPEDTKTDAAQTTDAASMAKTDEVATDAAAAKDVAAFVDNIAKQLPALYSQLPEPIRNLMPHADLDLAATVAANLGGDNFVHPHPPNAKDGVHEGVTCDKSGLSPIVGNRYHLNGHNYDLCEAEYDKLPEKEKALFVKIPPPQAQAPPPPPPPLGFHPGVQCDRSGMLPIVGTRFKLRGHNYDLCQAEFDKLADGEKAQYDAIPPPMTNAPNVANLASAFAHGMAKHASAHAQAWANAQGQGQGPWRPHGRCGWGRGWGGGGGGGGGGGKGGMGGCGGGKGKGGHGEFGPPAGKGKGGCGPKFAARFVCDVTVFDGTQVAPNTPFTKIWRLKNVGDMPWPAGTKMLFVGGDQMSTEMSVPLGRDTPVMPGEEVDAAVEMKAPSELGRYLGYWRLTGPHERMRFGQRVWCHIQVVDPSQPAGAIDVESALAEFEKMKSNLGSDDADADDDAAPPEAAAAAMAAEATAAAPSGTQGDLTDVLMPMRAEFVPTPPAPTPAPAAPPVPVVDGLPLDEKPETEPETEAEPMNDGSLSDDGVVVTETMVIEAQPRLSTAGPSAGEPLTVKAALEAMGFGDATMVEAAIEKNGQDLEACAADLASASEWGALLDDLHEMGFANVELNKRLMMKNSGNIKRTVKDLVEA